MSEKENALFVPPALDLEMPEDAVLLRVGEEPDIIIEVPAEDRVILVLRS